MSKYRKLLIVSGFLVAPVALGLAVWQPVAAQNTSAGRYTMHQTDDGMLRLDTQTGAVSLCNRSNETWSCQPMTDEKSSSGELERLKKDNARLRAEVDRLDKMLGVGTPRPNGDADPPRPGGEKHSFRLPSEQEVDQALNYFERMLKKLQDRLKKLEQGQTDEPKQL